MFPKRMAFLYMNLCWAHCLLSIFSQFFFSGGLRKTFSAILCSFDAMHRCYSACKNFLSMTHTSGPLATCDPSFCSLFKNDAFSALLIILYQDLQERRNWRKPCYLRENRVMPLKISISIEFYNGIVQFPCHSMAFLLVFICRLQTILVSEEVATEIAKKCRRRQPHCCLMPAPWGTV